MAKDLAPDWILQQALSTQNVANLAFLQGKPELRAKDGGHTLAVLGCGMMGKAILRGILSTLHSGQDTAAQKEITTVRLPTRFNACVRTSDSAKKVTEELAEYKADLIVWEKDNVSAVKASDTVLLSCEPYAVGDILRQPGMRDALAGKLLISICAGVPETYLRHVLHKDVAPDKGSQCRMVRATPNVAAAIRQSMTVISAPDPPLSEDHQNLVEGIFNSVGQTAWLPHSSISAGTALCGSGPACCALVLESMAAGAMSRGIPRDEAYRMAAHTMRGSADLVLNGEHPALLRDKVTTPGGCTAVGLQVLEEGCVRGTIAKAVREAAIKVDALEHQMLLEHSTKDTSP